MIGDPEFQHTHRESLRTRVGREPTILGASRYLHIQLRMSVGAPYKALTVGQITTLPYSYALGP